MVFQRLFTITLLILALGATSAHADSHVVVFAKDELTRKEYKYTVVELGVVIHLICDLEEHAAGYPVTRDGQVISGSPFTIDEDRTLSFETQAGGTFVIGQCMPPEPVAIIEVDTP